MIRRTEKGTRWKGRRPDGMIVTVDQRRNPNAFYERQGFLGCTWITMTSRHTLSIQDILAACRFKAVRYSTNSSQGRQHLSYTAYHLRL